MSLLPKNELRVAMGSRHCEASLWRAGFLPRRLAHAQGAGSDAAALSTVLAGLATEGHALPRSATLCLDDDLVHYALLPADGPWSTVQARATQHFCEVLGDDSLLVARRLLPGARRWLAVATDARQVSAWSQVLADQRCTLRSVGVALLEDLWRNRHQLALRNGVVACLRDHGLALAGWRDGQLQDLVWERCDMQQPLLWTQRIQAFVARLALTGASSPGDGVMLLAAPTALAEARQAIEPFADWQLISAQAAE